MIMIVLSIVIAFCLTAALTPSFARFLLKAGMFGFDLHKPGRPKIAEMGGPIVVAGALAGIFFFIWAKVFLFGSTPELITLFAAISTILIVTIIGILDDLSSLSKFRPGGKRAGLAQWQKPLLTAPAAIPLMAIMAGDTSLALPLLGTVNFGALFPLLIVPAAVMAAANGTNMLGGLNGLEASLGTILLGSLGLFAYLQGQTAAALLALTLAAGLLGFLLFNWYPAKILPGDSLTYLIGATAATVAIIGNIERFAVLCFAPWFAEFVLKAKTRFKGQCFGVLQPDGSLRAPRRISSLTHAAMAIAKREPRIVALLCLLELTICGFAFAIYL